jgi:hypothetical protein
MKTLLFSLFICIIFSAQAQYRLAFTNADSSKTVIIKQKDLARLSYKGYMSQPQEAEGNVSSITDSSISLAPRKKFLQKKRDGQTILIRDITGFRLYSKFRPAAETIYAVASVGITGAVAGIISDASSSTVVIILSSAATATVTTAMKNIFFSHRIKNYLVEGWTMRLLQNQLQPAK